MVTPSANRYRSRVPEFSSDFIAAVLTHTNHDHPEDSPLIARETVVLYDPACERLGIEPRAN
jgi:hypothetical protein